ncbi:MAG: hypothetical protein HKN08_12130 [Gammaproteobacteria bacterium]|nr:hypothetical protein [Gammaproteobacteria bacterium]
MMDEEKTTFIRTTLNNSLENLKQIGIPINTLSKVKLVFSNNQIDYHTGSLNEELLVYAITNNTNIANDDDAIQKKLDILVRDAKMVALCLAYLSHFDKGTDKERLLANEWRRMEREITLHELNEMQTYYNG